MLSCFPNGWKQFSLCLIVFVGLVVGGDDSPSAGSLSGSTLDSPRRIFTTDCDLCKDALDPYFPAGHRCHLCVDKACKCYLSRLQQSRLLSSLTDDESDCPGQCVLLLEDAPKLQKMVGSSVQRSVFVEKYAELIERGSVFRGGSSDDPVHQWRQLMNVDVGGNAEKKVGKKMRDEIQLGLSSITPESTELGERLRAVREDVERLREMAVEVEREEEREKLLKEADSRHRILSIGVNSIVEEFTLSGEKVVVKRPTFSLGADAMKATINEIKCNIAAKEAAPDHVVPFMGWYMDLKMYEDDPDIVQSVVALVFKYVPMTLADFIEEPERMRGSPGLFRSLVQQLVLSVASLNRAGLIHLDLKPHNVFVEPKVTGSHILLVGDFDRSYLTEPPGFNDPATNGYPEATSPEIMPPEALMESIAQVESQLLGFLSGEDAPDIYGLEEVFLPKTHPTDAGPLDYSQKVDQARGIVRLVGRLGLGGLKKWDSWSVGMIIGSLLSGDHFWLVRRYLEDRGQVEIADIFTVACRSTTSDIIANPKCALLAAVGVLGSGGIHLPITALRKLVVDNWGPELGGNEGQLANLMARLATIQLGTRAELVNTVYHPFIQEGLDSSAPHKLGKWSGCGASRPFPRVKGKSSGKQLVIEPSDEPPFQMEIAEPEVILDGSGKGELRLHITPKDDMYKNYGIVAEIWDEFGRVASTGDKVTLLNDGGMLILSGHTQASLTRYAKNYARTGIHYKPNQKNEVVVPIGQAYRASTSNLIIRLYFVHLGPPVIDYFCLETGTGPKMDAVDVKVTSKLVHTTSKYGVMSCMHAGLYLQNELLFQTPPTDALWMAPESICAEGMANTAAWRPAEKTKAMIECRNVKAAVFGLFSLLMPTDQKKLALVAGTSLCSGSVFAAGDIGNAARALMSSPKAYSGSSLKEADGTCPFDPQTPVGSNAQCMETTAPMASRTCEQCTNMLSRAATSARQHPTAAGTAEAYFLATEPEACSLQWTTLGEMAKENMRGQSADSEEFKEMACLVARISRTTAVCFGVERQLFGTPMLPASPLVDEAGQSCGKLNNIPCMVAKVCQPSGCCSVDDASDAARRIMTGMVPAETAPPMEDSPEPEERGLAMLARMRLFKGRD